MTKQVDVEKLKKYVEYEERTMTKEKALKSLQAIGILDKNGDVTEPYKGVFVKVEANA